MATAVVQTRQSAGSDSIRPADASIPSAGSGDQRLIWHLDGASRPAAGGTINLTELLENSTIGPLQIRVFTLCMMCLIMDGFDVQAMGYVAPAVVRDWGVARSLLGPVFAAANFGVLIGSLVFSMVADKIGRRPVLIGATLFFSVMTIATAYAQNVQQLLWLRFIAGIGHRLHHAERHGAGRRVQPQAQPRHADDVHHRRLHHRRGARPGSWPPWLIPAFGWRSVFIFGGAVPLVDRAAMSWGLPESLQFLAVRRPQSRPLAKWLKKLDPSLRVDAADANSSPTKSSGSGVPFVHLFREGRGVATLLLWVVNFMNLADPVLAVQLAADGRDRHGLQPADRRARRHRAAGRAARIGTFGLAWLIARGGFIPTLTLTFAVATISIALIGQPGLALTPRFIVFIAGWCVIGGQPGINALSATFYPTYLRSTGVGSGLGVGRIGAIVGPYVGGILLAQQWSSQQLFYATAVPALISTLTIIALWKK